MDRDQEQVIERIRKALTCPVDWEKLTKGNATGLVTELHDYWKEIIVKHSVDTESRHAGNLYFNPYDEICDFDPTVDPANDNADGDDLDILKAELINIVGCGAENGWIESARQEYILITRPLSNLKVADDSIQKKHYLPPNASKEDYLKGSASGVSKIYRSLEHELLEIIWWCIDGHKWKELITGSKKYLFVQHHKAVGAAHGKETNFLKFDFDISTPQVHTYPIGENEVVNISELVFYDW